MNGKVIGFERLKEEYDSCPDFKDIFLELQRGQSNTTNSFRLEAGYLFKKTSCASLGLQFGTL